MIRPSSARVSLSALASAIAWLVAPLAPSAVAAAAQSTPELEVAFERALKEEKLQGAVWSTVAADGSVTIGAAGTSDAGTNEPMRPGARVHVGSVAKVVLAIGILRLVTEGRLALDTPVTQVLASIRFDNPWADKDPVTIRHLLEHTAGLENLRLWQVFSLTAEADTPLVVAFTRDPSLLRVHSRPGSRFSYSNMGYALLGMVIEAITSQPYERYLDGELLQPLSMHDSTFAFVSQTGEHADTRLAMGHFEDGAKHAAVPVYLRPATQFTTTAADMALFARFLMSDGRIKGRPFIDAELLADLGTPARTEAARGGLSIGHGLALAGRDRHGVLGLCHPGTTVGFRAMLCLFPLNGSAFFVAMNADVEAADYDRFDDLLIGTLEVPPPATVRPARAAADFSAWNGLYVQTPLPSVPFAWIDTVLNFVRVHWDGTHLRVDPFQSRERVLVPIGNRIFSATDRTTASHVLLQSTEGARILSDGLRSYEQVSTTRIVLLWASLLLGLGGLAYILVAGLYRLLRQRLRRSSALFVPFLAIVALLLPVPFYVHQSFLQLGDRTTASVLLAIVTGALPLALSVGVIVCWRQGIRRPVDILEVAALLATLQWTLVLAAWSLIPVRLWI